VYRFTMESTHKTNIFQNIVHGFKKTAIIF